MWFTSDLGEVCRAMHPPAAVLTATRQIRRPNTHAMRPPRSFTATLVICSLLPAGLLAQQPIKHRFLAADESRGQLIYVNQFDPTQDWTLKTPEKHRDMQLIGGGKLLVNTGSTRTTSPSSATANTTSRRKKKPNTSTRHCCAAQPRHSGWPTAARSSAATRTMASPSTCSMRRTNRLPGAWKRPHRGLQLDRSRSPGQRQSAATPRV